MSDEVQRPDDDDYDLLTVGEAGARLAIEIQAGRKRLDELEQQLAYIGESTAIAGEIAAVERRIEDLQAAAARVARPLADRYTAAIERDSRRLEALEERFAYIGEDSQVATEIAEVEQRLEGLRAAQARAAEPRQEQLAADIATESTQLEALEERFAYIGEDSGLATQIADLERHLEALKAEAAGDPPGLDDA